MPDELNQPEKPLLPEKPDLPPQADRIVETPHPDAESVAETAHEKVSERYSEILGQVRGSQPSTPVAEDDESAIAADAKAVYAETDAESRVAKLVSLAEAKGPVYAVRVARKLDDLYVLDRTHDALAEKFHDALKEKGLL